MHRLGLFRPHSTTSGCRNTRTAQFAIRKYTAVTQTGTCSNETPADNRINGSAVRPNSSALDSSGGDRRSAQAAVAAPAVAPTASPVPSAETWFTGYIDLGYQWLAGPGGSFDTYRSVVNLGSGPKLVGTDFTILDPKRRLFDRIRVRAYDWGDQPYESLHVFANKQGVYEINAEYRRLAYFQRCSFVRQPIARHAWRNRSAGLRHSAHGWIVQS